jgi:hypothetical protein
VVETEEPCLFIPRNIRVIRSRRIELVVGENERSTGLQIFEWETSKEELYK